MSRCLEVIDTRVRHGEKEFLGRVSKENPGLVETVIIENSEATLAETRAYKDPSGPMLFTYGEKFPFKTDATLFAAELRRKIEESSPGTGVILKYF